MNAVDVTFDGRLPVGRKSNQRNQLYCWLDRPMITVWL